MYDILEKEYTFGYMYEKYNDGTLLNQVKIVSLKKDINNITYLILIDTLGRSIFDAYKYLNHYLIDSKWKKREKAVQALKAYFTFAELFSIPDYKNLSKIEFKKFITFLRGGHSTGYKTNFIITTTRSKTTINQYMAVYRDFLTILNINKGPFFNKKTIGKQLISSATSAGKNVSVDKHNSNQSISNKNRIPKYIGANEYNRILDNIKTKYSLRELIIVKLLYEYGLRISEVLGITLEDIRELDGEYKDQYFIIILRNRISDKQYQKCKNLMQPTNKEDYSSTNYQEIKIGYYEVVIHKEIFYLIRQYIDETRDILNMTSIALNNINRAKADKAEISSNIRENYYVFISKNYTPISSSGWNKIIRQIFKESGIKLDVNVRKDNLNHRFRHGFAMICVKNNVDRYTLKELMRHKNVSTVDIYYNPTVEDNIEMAVGVNEIIKRNLGINVKNLI